MRRIEMFHLEVDENSITIAASSEMSMVDRIAGESDEFFKQFGITAFSKYRLVLRELLINAIEHGNKKSIGKKVVCSIKKLEGPCFEVNVRDQGAGFDHSKLEMKMPTDPEHVRNRGFPLINHFCDAIDFNKKGNEITVYIPISHETSIEVKDHADGYTEITPNGDLTASIAENFRNRIMEPYEQGKTRFRFDLSNVRDIDSMGLSILICFGKLLKKKGDKTEILFSNVCEGLQRLFRLTHMDKMFSINN